MPASRLYKAERRMNKREIVVTLSCRRPYRNVLQLRIVLRGTNPPVWRRIQIPESYAFYDLHVAIQNAMGWTDSHLHMFEVAGRPGKKARLRIYCPFMEPDLDEGPLLLTTEVSVRDHLAKKNDKAVYEYDFGDGWLHELVVEGVKPRASRVRYPLCLDGEGACPPEDCGGVHGYYECIRAFENRGNSEGLLTWLGRWRPDRFDPKSVVFESPRKRLEESLGD